MKLSPCRLLTACQLIWHSQRCFGQTPPAPGSRLKGRAVVSSEWHLEAREQPDTIVRVSVGLTQSRFGELERRLYEVSDPHHQDYGQYLTQDQLDELVRPHDSSIQAVLAWLNESIDLDDANMSFSRAQDWIYLSLTIGQLESLLQTEYFVFRHSEDRSVITRSIDWFLPDHVAGHIDLIEPTTAFLRPRAQWRYGAPDPEWENSNRLPTYEELVEEDLLDRGPLEIPSEDQLPANPTVQQACNRLAISPLCLGVLYGTHNHQVALPSRTTIGMINFLGEVANRSDLDLFLTKYRPAAASANAAHTFPVHLIAGATDQQTPNTPSQMAVHKGYEGALDVQTILGIAWPLSISVYNVGGRPPFHPLTPSDKNTNEPYLPFLQHMRTLANPPSVISISYADDEKTVPPEYARRVCQEFAALTARGVSILVASGDYGVGREGRCVGGTGTNKKFMPSFPASCPFVTAVGATRFLEPEMVAFDARTEYASGGGFSDLFGMPGYQRRDVERYLGSYGGQWDGWFNPWGRAYPDVAAMGYHFVVVWNGSEHLQDGTSASTPVVAAVVALVNEVLAEEERPPLGFLNPWIYGAGREGFTDVRVGSNRGCNTSGFPAVEGWDPATGLGTPWFPKLKELALKAKFRPTVPWYYLDGLQ